MNLTQIITANEDTTTSIDFSQINKYKKSLYTYYKNLLQTNNNKHMNTQTNTANKVYTIYSDYAKAYLKANHIKLKTVYVENGNYNEHFIYLARVGSCDSKYNNQFRVLVKHRDVVKNCIMVTFDTEKVDKNFIEYKLKSYSRVINRMANGTCQRFITQTLIAQILSGCINLNGSFNNDVLYKEV